MSTDQRVRVGILFGGKSLEREVSFNSGRTVCDHIDENKFASVPIFQDEDGSLYLLPWRFLHRGKISDFQARLKAEAPAITWDDLPSLIDICFIAVHGRTAEDGTLQGMLEILGIPYTNSKVLGSALGMDKITQKKWMRAHGISVPRDIAIYYHQVECLTVEALHTMVTEAKLSFPLVVKPADEGSSLGINMAHDHQELLAAINQAAWLDKHKPHNVLIEEHLEGMEFTAISLEHVGEGWKNLSVTEVIKEAGAAIYDYDQKYMPGRASKITPARCSQENLARIARLCEQLSATLNFNGSSRIDGFLRPDDTITVIDPNTISGMGPASFMFDQAIHAGFNHTTLITHMIELELNRITKGAIL